jgi:hypothetical protein
MDEYELILKKFMREMNSSQGPLSLNKSETQPEVNWSLSELENIVYDFVNFPKSNKEAEETRFKPMDVKKEDLMKI